MTVGAGAPGAGGGAGEAPPREAPQLVQKGSPGVVGDPQTGQVSEATTVGAGWPTEGEGVDT
jgi:hypothetical protein